MNKSSKSVSAEEMHLLREGIKRQYAAYHARDRDTYPAFEFNSSRANYQPLKDSFEEEFFLVRKIDRVHNFLHIPSLNTLALLFSDPAYVPGTKILNTCRSYAEGVSQPANAPPPVDSTATPGYPKRTKLLLVSVATALFLLLSALAGYWLLVREKATAGGLVIRRPYPRQVVPRMSFVEGKVTNANFVWVVVHPVLKDQKFYVQDPANVNKDGTWKTRIFVGKADHTTDGQTFEIRAYVKPGGPYTAIATNGQYEYDRWPETAELATQSILVVRGSQQK
ncbi:hypothetical protein [uncultured Fibrella sp.]|uniref:hypothetical protein n=1 Tax=uncultured Fibrella sp. TaxID=1284596 RepID=UPI0035C99D5F